MRRDEYCINTYKINRNNLDQTGDLKFEFNAEYRFNIYKIFKGALFTDVGNIWLLEEDPRKPGSGLSNEWLSELAVGTGLGRAQPVVSDGEVRWRA